MILRDIRVPLVGEKAEFISVRMTYSLGGTNPWSGRCERRGYWLSATPVSIERGFHAYCPTDGMRMFLKEVSRASRKAEAEASRIADKSLETLVLAVSDKNGFDRSHVLLANRKEA